MRETITRIKKQLDDFWQGLNKSQKIRFIIIVSAVILGLLVMGIVFSRDAYDVLYSGLDTESAAEITSKLDELDIPWKSELNNTTIKVPKNMVDKARMQLVSEGIPKQPLTFQEYMKEIKIGTTDQERQKLFVDYIRRDLANSIKTLDNVEDAIVYIGMPEEDNFVIKDNNHPVTASVILKIRRGAQLEPQNVKAVESLVANSIEGLKPENVTIIDNNANILSSDIDDQQELVNNQIELKNKFEQMINQRIKDLLEPVFGYNKIVAASNVVLDFDKKVSETVKFEPVIDDEGIVVSVEKLKEKMQNPDGGGVPGIDSNDGAAQYVQPDEGDSSYEKKNEIKNYEVNQIKEQIEQAQGQIKDLSISVIIDSSDVDQTALSGTGLEEVRTLVASAVGIDPSFVNVQNMPFSKKGLKDDINEAFSAAEQLKKKQRLTNIIIVSAVAVIIILLVVFARRNARKSMQELETQQETAAVVDETEELFQDDEQSKKRNQIEKLIRQKPEEVAGLIRTWLNED
ncbi:MAG: flagellar basal-body MS-ring/collar protein FliF [Clostridia bacterium]|nr:flagellar basal-body MS-ring/collar protein FliF [Clostridia bacterium]